MRGLYDRALALAAHRHGVWWLALVTFASSIFLPVPEDALLIAMILAARERAWLLAGVCTLASVAGGLAAWWIGYEVFDHIGRPLLALYGQAGAMEGLRAAFNEYGWWIVLGGGLTPFPYMAVAIAAGALALPLGVFLAASTLGRGLRYFALAFLLWRFGPAIRRGIERRFALATTVAFAALVGVFALAAWVV